MSDYFAQFRLVEVQRTFYKPPRLDTAVKWRREAPSDFEFSIKAWQLITHPPTSPTYRKAGITTLPGPARNYGSFSPTPKVRQAWEVTAAFGRALGARVIVFQCPPSFAETQENIENVRRFFHSLGDAGFLFAWEPRGGWRGDTVRALCSELGLIRCVDPFETESLHGRPRYFRLHGGSRYQHHYTPEELERLRAMVGNEEAYVLFNNINMCRTPWHLGRC